ncbi:unnamed protein product [Linum tenue]|uniref:Acid phosphatase/vanadium-dependent haloperoxidase-related protein n=1 Tax=Linum tenue TaxID=586396 RepID=A0AAV0PFI3_9ROSI|nr:unnamed protein product [Linum tenue]
MACLTLFRPSFFSLYSSPSPPSSVSHLCSSTTYARYTATLPSTNPSIRCSCSNPSDSPRKPSTLSTWSNHSWVLVPILREIGGKTSSHTKKWVSLLQSYSHEADKEAGGGNYLHNSGFGLALLSITSNARVKFSPFVAALAANPTFLSGLLAWFAAQSIKVCLNFFVERRWDFRILFASGGMPSSHSALCTALTTSVAFCHGVADSLFPVCLGFSLIVMYDAIGVRRHAGMQAEVLNMIVEDMFQGHPISERKLKELLGHTPSQVVAGALLGILAACICCQSGLVAT